MLAVAVAAVSAIFGGLARWLGDYVSASGQVAGRMAVASAAACLVSATGLRLPAGTLERQRSTKRVRAVYVAAFPVVVISFTISVQSVSVSIAVACLFSGSVLTTNIVALANGDQVGRAAVVPVALAAVGLSLLWCVGCTTHWPGMVAGLIAGVAEGTSHLARQELQKHEAVELLPRQFMVAAVLALIALLVVQSPIPQKQLGPGVIATVALFGIGVVIIAYALILISRRVPAEKLAVILTTELIFAAGVDWVVWRDPLTVREMLGLCLVAGASAAAAYVRPSTVQLDD